MAKLSAGVFGVCVFLGVGFASFHSRAPNWKFIVIISTIVTGVFAVRAYFLLRSEEARVSKELTPEIRALQKLVDSMALLSLADLSVFITAQQQLTHDEDEFVFVTSLGSPVHKVGIHMKRLGLAAHLPYTQMSEAELDLTKFSLTPEGKDYLGTLLDGVAKRRRFLARQATAG
ncbi:hypothetical protein [Qipengyuania seohaensis]|uniref:hypothetical protein n=1 Tax=Qipengyuania seohaensis TaxID=266951 RepID=UPI0012FDFF71|nr:hypothetical protein [Qipengyuania seohaensis]